MASLKSVHRSDIATLMMDCSLLLVGSPTLNNNIFPTLADTLYYLKGLKPKGIKAATFGSYGWTGEAAKDIAEILAGMKLDVIHEPYRIKYIPTKEDLIECREFGRKIGLLSLEA